MNKGATAIIDRQAQRKHLSFPLNIHILHTHTCTYNNKGSIQAHNKDAIRG